jgi:amino acid transporter
MHALMDVAGFVIVAIGLYMFWGARPSATGPIRRFAFSPYMEPIYPVIAMSVVLIGAVLIAAGFGLPVGPQ